jgi:mevalonate kinase
VKTYYSKVLLFGEHTVNLGSQGLAMPLGDYGGHWANSNDRSLQYNLVEFARYLEANQTSKEAIFQLDTEGLVADLEQGRYFKSSVKQGYGTGSSGVLCAAIYDTYGNAKLAPNFFNFNQLKAGFAQMESFFHGKSSGIDPLISYLNEPLLITTHGITTVSLPSYLTAGNAIFLLDTLQERKAEPLIQWFMQSVENENFKTKIKEELVAYNNIAIAAFLEGHWTNLMKAAHQISTFQLQYLLPLIPASFHSLWQQGLESDNFKLKICGAGGGGFILGISKDFNQTQQLLADYSIAQIYPMLPSLMT